MQDNKIKLIRDSVHGDIQITDDVIWDLIDSSEMQRLRRIMQLGPTQLAYPGATHTRFSHSIGTYHIVCEFIKSEGFQTLDEKDSLKVKIAGLLHDIGHGAFSHTFELISNANHEEYTVDIILNPEGNIFNILNKNNIDPKEIVDIINGVHNNKILNLLVSSQLDADRLDYLIRDSHHCNVNYAGIDLSRITKNAKIVKDKIVFNKKAIFAIEGFLLGRYYMYKQVYNHKISSIFDTLFEIWFKRIKDLHKKKHDFKEKLIPELFEDFFNNKKINLNSYLQIDDYTMQHIFKQSIKEGDEILSDISERLIGRNLFNFELKDLKHLEELKKELKKQNLDYKYYLNEKTIKEPKIYQEKNQKDEKKDENIYIINNSETLPLSKLTLLKTAFDKINENKEKKVLIFWKK